MRTRQHTTTLENLRIPVQAKLAYQNALVDREGSPSDQLDALAQFWAASAYAQTAVMLARN